MEHWDHQIFRGLQELGFGSTALMTVIAAGLTLFFALALGLI